MGARRDIEDADGIFVITDMSMSCYVGTALHRKNIHDYDKPLLGNRFEDLSTEHKKIVWDSFIEDLKNPITEIGDYYEDFIEWCDGNVKELRAGIREIMGLALGWWRDDSIDVNRYVEELLDYAQKSEQEEKLEEQKTSTLNSLCQNLPGGQKEGIAHDLSQLLCIMEKNTHGGLEPEDVKIIETNLPKWKKQIQEMRISLENAL